jgi:hypothetical protein
MHNPACRCISLIVFGLDESQRLMVFVLPRGSINGRWALYGGSETCGAEDWALALRKTGDRLRACEMRR